MTTATLDAPGVDTNAPLYTGYYDDFQEPAAQEPLATLTPGRYILELPRSIKGVQRTDKLGRNGIDFNLGGARCVEDDKGNPVNGMINRFFKVSTLPRGNAKFSDAADLLAMFGVEFRYLTTVDEWQSAMDSIAGQRTKAPIRCEIEGSYKHPLTQAWVNLRTKDFRLGTGYARVGYLVNNQFTLTPAFPADVVTNDQKKAFAAERGWVTVFGNFQPGYRPFGVADDQR